MNTYCRPLYNSQALEISQVPEYSQVDKDIVVHIFTKEYYLQWVKDENLLFETTCKGLDNTLEYIFTPSLACCFTKANLCLCVNPIIVFCWHTFIWGQISWSSCWRQEKECSCLQVNDLGLVPTLHTVSWIFPEGIPEHRARRKPWAQPGVIQAPFLKKSFESFPISFILIKLSSFSHWTIIVTYYFFSSSKTPAIYLEALDDAL